MPSTKLWGVPPIRDTYERLPQSPAGRFNGRDFASVATNTLVASGALATSAAAIEAFVDNQSTAGMAGGVGVWCVQMLFFMLLKVVATVLRDSGGSIVRDVLAWAWSLPWLVWGWSAAAIKRPLSPTLTPTRQMRTGLLMRLLFKPKKRRK